VHAVRTTVEVGTWARRLPAERTLSLGAERVLVLHDLTGLRRAGSRPRLGATAAGPEPAPKPIIRPAAGTRPPEPAERATARDRPRAALCLHHPRPRMLRLLLPCLLLLSASPLVAQEDPPPPGEEEAVAETPVDDDEVAAEAEEAASETIDPDSTAAAEGLDIEILKARMRPLTLEQAQERLDSWLDLLRKKCLAVAEAEVEALGSTDATAVDAATARAVELRTERGRLIERTQVVIDSVEDKGGDVSEAQAYVDSVVVTPPITGMRAAWSTVLTWAQTPDGGIRLAINIARAIGVLIATWIVALLLGRLTGRAMKRVRGASHLLRGFIAKSVRRVVLILGFFVALGQLGFDMTPMIAAIGAAGLVVGLALQGTLSNFASGILIMFYRPFDVGDAIATSGPSGMVEGMTLVTTTIKTFDNQTVHVPNNTVWGGVITNITANPTRRVDMTFGIGYDDDYDRAAEILMEIVKAHDKVLDDPAPVVRLHELGDSSVNFICRPWSNTPDYWDVYWDVTREVKRRFDEEGISIPFPQRDVHLYPAGSGDDEVTPHGKPTGTRETAKAGADAPPVD